MLCYLYARCNRTHIVQKVQVLSRQSTEYFPKSLGDHQDVFWQNWDKLLCSVCSAVVFVLELCHAGHFCPVSFFGGVMNTDLNWGKWGLQFFGCCCGVFCDLLDGSLLHSWGNFGWPGTPGTVYHCSVFLPFVVNGSHCGSLESQSFRNGFITFSSLIDLNHFLPHLFLNFFGSWSWCLAFEDLLVYITL